MLITLVQYTDNDGNAPLSVQEPPMHQYYKQVHDVEVLSIENGDCEFNALLNLDQVKHSDQPPSQSLANSGRIYLSLRMEHRFTRVQKLA